MSQLQQSAYIDRYCAFVDILGFRGMIEGLRNGSTSFDALRTLLARVHGANTRVDDTHAEADLRVQSISDAVAISSAVNSAGLLHILKSLQALAIDLLLEGYFIRGAVVKAPLYHDDLMVFGEGLVKAFHYESEVAKYPRIVVVRDVREDMLRYAGQSQTMGSYPSMDMLRQSADGPMYLDVLQPIASLLQRKDHPYEKLTDLEKSGCQKYMSIKDRIRQRYEEAMDDPRHFEKVRWFAQYWSNAMPSHLLLSIRDAARTF